MCKNLLITSNSSYCLTSLVTTDLCCSLCVHLELVAGLVGEALELVVALWSETAFSLLWAWLQIGELRQEVLRIVSLV